MQPTRVVAFAGDPFALKRVYAPAAEADGTRILVDRLWPRGLSRQKAAIDIWMKDIAPSVELRRWFDHDPARWAVFQHGYKAELDARPEVVAELRRLIQAGPATLLYGAKDSAHNHALVLADYLRSTLIEDRRRS
ncbi:DUF488 family protein [Brevundimonas sp.]|uniref:DUF488 domain-containing protein n=1 Tax=Brevundimonas sp. TaxID=1871086 RepID=UPI00289D6D8D|nr:DUF488 family protein [Brevundimonas sp.]